MAAEIVEKQLHLNSIATTAKKERPTKKFYWIAINFSHILNSKQCKIRWSSDLINLQVSIENMESRPLSVTLDLLE